MDSIGFGDCLILIGAMVRLKKMAVFGFDVDLKGEQVSIENKEDDIIFIFCAGIWREKENKEAGVTF